MHTLACLNEFASGFSERFRMTQNGSFGWGKGAAATGGLGERRRRSGPAGQEDKQLQQDHQDTASHLVKLREGPHRTHTRSTHAQRIHASCGHALIWEIAASQLFPAINSHNERKPETGTSKPRKYVISHVCIRMRIYNNNIITGAHTHT
jgi:hypothetical protein